MNLLVSFATPTNGATLHKFAGVPADGAFPDANLINVNGILYSTTESGGANNKGTIFSITPNGTETVLHSFQGGSDGAKAETSLINVGGILYGTTSEGGGTGCGDGCGTVFSITPDGTETVLHSFGNGRDGAQPLAGLINVKGIVYGTTFSGNTTSLSYGTVFSVDLKTGKEILLHSFQGGSDGSSPIASLVKVDGILYGTTVSGGSRGDWGTVFQLTPPGSGQTQWTETVLYSFQGYPADGANPRASLINVGGALYGTTAAGGTGSCPAANEYGQGCGTVFSIDLKTGTESVLYSFQNNGADGNNPYASLINVGGTLYGTTEAGGTGTCEPPNPGCGTVFSITPGGIETVIHSFEDNYAVGAHPVASLIDVQSTLYGTTLSGGRCYRTSNCGTVFSIKP